MMNAGSLIAAAGIAAMLWAFVTIAREHRRDQRGMEAAETVERRRLSAIADRQRRALVIESASSGRVMAEFTREQVEDGQYRAVLEAAPAKPKRRLRTLVDELGEWHPDTAAPVAPLLFNETASDWAALGRFRTITPAVLV